MSPITPHPFQRSGHAGQMGRELDPAKRRRHAFELDRGKTGFGSLTQRSSAAAHCVLPALPAAGGNGDREI